MKTEKTAHSINIFLGPGPSLDVVAKAIETLDYNSTKKQFFENRKLYAQLYRPLTPEKPRPIHATDQSDTKPKPSKGDGIVKSAVSNINQSSEPKSKQARKNSNSQTSLSSAATSTVARHKEDTRGSNFHKK